ncbi:MAG: metal-dependent transcriptional regulator [Acidobacteria bacterium]|nr:metal-dependent transcriptional regulator [Acidobacteriota bacterium]
MATSAAEDYLKAILIEEQRSGAERVGMGQIAAALGVAPGTVTSMVKALDDGGLVAYEPYGGVRLTTAGRQLAAHVVRRHRLIELFLVRVLGLDWSEVHAEAELLEHAASGRIIDRMDEMLGHPTVDPHGDPIPDAEGALATIEHPDLLHCPAGVPLRIVRVSDQGPEFLRLVERSGLAPGSRVTVERHDQAADTIHLRVEDGRRVSLGSRAASKLLAEPSVPQDT